jgi:hypothetical protein
VFDDSDDGENNAHAGSPRSVNQIHN